MINRIINSGGTNELADDDTLCTVDHKCTCLCHQRQVTHKYLMLIDFVCFFIVKTYLDFQGSCVCGISLLAFLNGVFDVALARAEREIYKFQA